jgi:hypothetical protein
MLPLGRFQPVPKGQKMTLTVLLEQFSYALKVIFCHHICDSEPKIKMLGELQKFSRKLEEFGKICLTGAEVGVKIKLEWQVGFKRVII